MPELFEISDEVVQLTSATVESSVELSTDTEALELHVASSSVSVGDSDSVIIIEETEPDVLEVGIAGSQGIQGVPGNDATGFVQGSVTVISSETKVIDISVDKISTEWNVAVKDLLFDKWKFCKISGLINDDFCVYDIRGDTLPFKFSVSGMVLSMTNNHINNVLVRFSKNSIGI